MINKEKVKRIKLEEGKYKLQVGSAMYSFKTSARRKSYLNEIKTQHIKYYGYDSWIKIKIKLSE